MFKDSVFFKTIVGFEKLMFMFSLEIKTIGSALKSSCSALKSSQDNRQLAWHGLACNSSSIFVCREAE